MPLGIVRELIRDQPLRAARTGRRYDRLEVIPDLAVLADAVERHEQIGLVPFGIVAVHVRARLPASHPGIVMLEEDRPKHEGSRDDGRAQERDRRSSSRRLGSEGTYASGDNEQQYS
jgi:hypothetical protein